MYTMIYAFTLATGQVLTIEREAHTRHWRPVRSMQQCRDMAVEQEARHRRAIQLGNGLIVDVTIRCEKR